jgi:exonuclease SbcD
MPEPIRILHFADTHIGMENYGRLSPQTGLNSRVEDFLRRMDEMIAYAREHDVDLTIFAGDAFKTRTPNPTFQREFAWRVRDLTELAPLVMLVGNHDLPPMALKASSIEIYDTLAVPDVWVADDFELKVINTKRGPVAVGAAPYPIRSRLLQDEATAGYTISQIDMHLQEVLYGLIDDMAVQAEALDMPRLLTGHFTVAGATWGSERQIMLGRDIEIPRDLVADPRWDYVALGHIHKHQNLTANRDSVPPVVYSGSIERIDFGEEHDVKGFCWVELERGKTNWSFVPLHARSFVTLEADLKASENPTQETVALIESRSLEGAVVRLILDLTPETEAAFNEGVVRDVLRQSGISYLAAIRKNIQQYVRARLGGNPEELDDVQLLERYLISKQVDETRRVELMDAAKDIFDSTLIARE